MAVTNSTTCLNALFDNTCTVHTHMYMFVGQTYSAGDKIEKNEMDGECSAYGGGERRVQGFGGET
jgi:hypothetical protein